MHYVTPNDLLDRFGARELAQAATPADVRVPPAEVVRALITGGDTGGFDPDDVEVAQIVVERVTEAISDAEELVDSYLGRRVDLTDTSALAGVLRRHAGHIARYHYHAHKATEKIENDYKDARKTLQMIADGEIGLGVNDPAPARDAAPRVSDKRPPRTFTEESLSDFVSP